MRLPDGTEAGLLGGVLRIGLDAYANVRPVRLLPGVEAPLKAKAGEIDYVIVRENTEGLYLSRGKGVGTSEAMADTLLVTRKGVERVARYAFELARRRAASGDSLDKELEIANQELERVARLLDKVASPEAPAAPRTGPVDVTVFEKVQPRVVKTVFHAFVLAVGGRLARRGEVAPPHRPAG